MPVTNADPITGPTFTVPAFTPPSWWSQLSPDVSLGTYMTTHQDYYGRVGDVFAEAVTTESTAATRYGRVWAQQMELRPMRAVLAGTTTLIATYRIFDPIPAGEVAGSVYRPGPTSVAYGGGYAFTALQILTFYRDNAYDLSYLYDYLRPLARLPWGAPPGKPWSERAITLLQPMP